MGRFIDDRVAVAPLGAAANNPLPLIGVFSNYANSPECSIYDSTFNLVSRHNQSQSGYASPTSGEIWSSYGGQLYTNSQVSSNSQTTYWIKSTVMNSADGSQLLRLSPNGGMAAKVSSSAGTLMSYFGVVIGEKGVRQRQSLYLSGAGLSQHLRGSPVVVDTLAASLNSANSAVWGGGGSSRGSVGYNDRTRTLCVVESKDGSCNYRLHLWTNKNRRLSGRSGELDLFVGEAKAGTGGASYQYGDFSWNANGSTSYSESQYRLRVIPADNGKVAVVRMNPHSGVYMGVLTPAASNTVVFSSSYQSVSSTTSYGVEKGGSYGMRHNITWDNDWVACYAPYYYYGSGLSGLLVNARDPEKYFKLSYGSSSDGVTLVPCGEAGFAYSFNQTNADGDVGLSIGVMDLAGLTAAAGSAVSMGVVGGFIDTGYTSTNYPCLAVVDSWER